MRQMPFPSVYLLEAAARVMLIVGSERHSKRSLRKSYRSTVSGGEFPVRQLRLAEDWLVDSGWICVVDDTLEARTEGGMLLADEADIVRTLARSYIVEMQPSWLGAVCAAGDLRLEFVPSDVVEVLGQLYDTPEREALLVAAASKFDAAVLDALGELGETTVLAEWSTVLRQSGRMDLVERVRRLSLISDALGYDIVAPDFKGEEYQLEVKCYRGPIANCFVTRNEFEVGCRLPNWRLVVCHASTDARATIVGWMASESLRDRTPTDRDELGKWQVARMVFRVGDLQPGLPLVV